MARIAKFKIGDIVMHKRQGYRAVVVDVDPVFQASGHFNPQSLKRNFSVRTPWYRLLVDESAQITYVEEASIELDFSEEKIISNPNVKDYLKVHKGRYQSSFSCH